MIDSNNINNSDSPLFRTEFIEKKGFPLLSSRLDANEIPVIHLDKLKAQQALEAVETCIPGAKHAYKHCSEHARRAGRNDGVPRTAMASVQGTQARVELIRTFVMNNLVENTIMYIYKVSFWSFLNCLFVFINIS